MNQFDLAMLRVQRAKVPALSCIWYVAVALWGNLTSRGGPQQVDGLEVEFTRGALFRLWDDVAVIGGVSLLAARAVAKAAGSILAVMALLIALGLQAVITVWVAALHIALIVTSPVWASVLWQVAKVVQRRKATAVAKKAAV